MREDVKTRLCGAAGALSTAIVVGALQSKALGANPFALQLTGTLVILSWLPYFYRISFFARIPPSLTFLLAFIWIVTCFGPVFVMLVIELFTGHRRPGSTWYHALWRIYAILALWIGFAVLNERYIRPWWRDNSGRLLGSVREDSVASQARKIALDKRTANLEAIKARVKVALNKKKLTEQTMEKKKTEIGKAKANITRAQDMLLRAHKTAAECDTAQKSDADDVVETMKDMLENATSHEKGLQVDVERLCLDLEDIQMQLDEYQKQWTEALHIQNYTGFYR